MRTKHTLATLADEFERRAASHEDYAHLRRSTHIIADRNLARAEVYRDCAAMLREAIKQEVSNA